MSAPRWSTSIPGASGRTVHIRLRSLRCFASRPAAFPLRSSAAGTTSLRSSSALHCERPRMARTAVLCAGPAALLAWSWLRLGQPHAGASTALWLIALGVVPALLSRPRHRLLVLVPASVLALHAALGVWIVHPLRLLGRFGDGFLEFYDVKLPFVAGSHPKMEGVVLVALFASCTVVARTVAARKPVLAALVIVVAAGWPATLLSGPDDLSRGVALLAVVPSLL